VFSVVWFCMYVFPLSTVITWRMCWGSFVVLVVCGKKRDITCLIAMMHW
jgi:hypothetical protein